MRKAILAFLLVMVMFGAMLGLAPAAQAGSPIVYRQAGNHWTPMWGAPSAGWGDRVQQWLSPGEPFYMECWTDNNWSGSNSQGWYNYWSVRWYAGWSKSHGWGWVHASYVYYPWTVRHC